MVPVLGRYYAELLNAKIDRECALTMMLAAQNRLLDEQ